jgi:uncharacterized protein YegL
MRKLPVYLLLDTSASMDGAPMTALEVGLRTLLSALRQDPLALETVYLSVITFDRQARQVVPMTEIAAFIPPVLVTGPATALGDALRLTALRSDVEVARSSATVKGDWKPMVFIMTDGSPTDDWQAGLAEFKKRNFGAVIACAAGRGARTDVLKQITDTVVEISPSSGGFRPRSPPTASASAATARKSPRWTNFRHLRRKSGLFCEENAECGISNAEYKKPE